ncbi:MAG: hypothetical protein ACK5NE_02605 [Brachymonas sp.]
MSKPVPHKKLTIADVQDLGRTLLDVANQYPTRYLTERDFFPLVITYLTGRIPSVVAEVSSSDGVIDFQLKGNNPTWLELAVQPRAIVDANCPSVKFPGHHFKNALYASQNRSELKKLMQEPTGKTRFLLLLDLTGKYDCNDLKLGYQREAKKFKKGKTIRVVYASQDTSKDCHFAAKA